MRVLVPVRSCVSWFRCVLVPVLVPDIDDRELEVLKAAAKAYARLSAQQIEAAVAAGELIEVGNENYEGK